MSATTATAPAPANTAIPWLGLTAVLLGTFISTLTGRLSSFGLADVRGAIGAGFDEGAWITTAFTVAQMLITPVAVWVGSIYGPRRILILAALLFTVTSAIIPYSQNLPTLLVLMFLAGLGSGCFIPLTLGYVLRSMPPRLWAYGVALYALNLELSLNISASVEGWYVDHLSWHWIFWQNVPLGLGMAICLHYGVRQQPPPALRINKDIYGLTTCGVGLALLYAALDQGNRVDWLNSGLIWGLLIAGFFLLLCFVLHERTAERPWLDFQVLLRHPMPFLLLMIALLRLTILSTSFLIPYFLGGVRGFRALQVGDTLIWIAVPQLIICLLAAIFLRRTDPRFVACFGLCLVGIACMMTAYTLTPVWGSDQFLISQLLQAVGQSCALSGIVFNAVLRLRPQDALSFGALLQISRLFGGEAGQAFISTLARVREQRASNLIGLHVKAGDPAVIHRLQGYGQVIARHDQPAMAAPLILGSDIRAMATTQSTIDCFVAVSAFAVLALFIMIVIMRAPPHGPASHRPFFARRAA
ncbi:MFS transporter [Acidisoma silvae]|uniref:MFS transporter n=1 Tax=Acidisoma silvae TaxID=2802396 RepID=A0A963YQT6_9PROT|nr:MFS transporter [Acidisoma silvae]MCB8875275.1 MFS transporter [Acidisoma silvae]